MEIAKLLDLSIKQAETNGSKADKSYVHNGREYNNYLDNASWQDFITEMKTLYYPIYENYKNGSGDELGIKNVGKYPPKMASYGSSSRMIYLLSRDLPEFCFEKKLFTTVGGTANMDGYLNKNGTDYYIEAKCREPYYSHQFTIDRKYEQLYRYLDKLEGLDFKCSIDIIDNKWMKVHFSTSQRAIEHFDIKQMICHLLGIATDKIEAPTEEKIQFLYLLYNPTKITIIEEPQKKKLLAMYEQEIDECDSIPFAELFNAIIDYLLSNTSVKKSSAANPEQLKNSFSFKRCDQTTFIETLK